MSSDTGTKVVILADNDDELRDSTQELLESAGYLVHPARNGRDALSRMRMVTGPAVAILDLVMPVMDGWTLIDTVRADADLDNIRILVMSGHDLHRPVQGADRTIRKPFKAAELLKAIEALLGGVPSSSRT